jgi:hypothetical protein
MPAERERLQDLTHTGMRMGAELYGPRRLGKIRREDILK